MLCDYPPLEYDRAASLLPLLREFLFRGNLDDIDLSWFQVGLTKGV
jgi:hypothetical protein